MKDISITSKELMEKNASCFPMRASEFSTSSFWYYTSLSTADLILKNKCIYVSNINEMNDLDEADLHDTNKDFVHCLCFCNSNTEKIPMWYLYAGIAGKGVSIGITPSVMLSFIGSIHSVATTDGKTILERDKDFDIEWGWIFYRKKENTSQVMYRRQWYSLTDPQNFEYENYYIKSYPWEYEKEFRIVFHNNTSIPHKQLVVDISSIYEKIKIKLAPELSGSLFRDSLPGLVGFTEYLAAIPAKSDLKINMNLCKRNYKGFLDYVKSNIKKKKEDRDVNVEEICKIINDAALCIKSNMEEYE